MLRQYPETGQRRVKWFDRGSGRAQGGGAEAQGPDPRVRSGPGRPRRCGGRRERIGLPAAAGGHGLDLDRWTGGLFRRLEETLGELGGGLFENTVRLGVTGLSRAGKTVFITSLVANLLDRGADAAAPRRRRGPHPGRLPAAAARPHHPALRLRGPPRRPDRPRAALAREHPLDLDPAPVAARRPDRPPHRLDRPPRRAPRHRRLPGRVAARPAADEPGLRRLVRGDDRRRPHPGARSRTPRPSSPSSTPPTPPARSTSRPPAPSPRPSPPTSPPPAPPASPRSPPAAS